MVSRFGSLGYTIMGKTVDLTVVQKTIIDTLFRREPQSYEDCQANRFKIFGEFHKEWTEAEVKASRATTYRCVKEFGYSCRQRRLNWAKEKKNWTVAQ